MDISFKVEGLRSIRSMPFIDLKPITILAGLNSSGKSTFLRSLPLLKQSDKSEINIPILWQGNLVDFENFSTAVSKTGKSCLNEISFSFRVSEISLEDNFITNEDYEISTQYLSFFDYIFPNLKKKKHLLKNIIFSFSIKETENDNGEKYAVFKKLLIEISNLDMKFELGFSDDGTLVDSLIMDNKELNELIDCKSLHFKKNSIFFDDLVFDFSNKKSKRKLRDSIFLSELIREISFTFMNGTRYDDNGIFSISKTLPGIIDDVSEHFRHDIDGIKNHNYFKEIFEMASKTDLKFLTMIGKLILLWLVIHRFNHMYYFTFVSRLNYLEPTRTSNARYHPHKNYGVYEISPDGKNLSSFFATLREEQLMDFSNWTKDLFGFGLEIEKQNGLVSIRVNYKGISLNVADTGYGISQILPVLAQIWWSKNRTEFVISGNSSHLGSNPCQMPRTFAMEQPELHLHPKQQANLADALVSAVTSPNTNALPSPRFIVETHSEKLISRLSKLIYEKKIRHADVQVVLFTSTNQDNPIETTVEVFPFNESGKLKNFPPGFFNSR